MQRSSHVLLFAVVLLVTAGLAATMALIVWRRRAAPGRIPFALLMLALTEWEFIRALEAVAVAVPAKMLWARVEYLGIASVAPLWLMFALEYGHRDKWLTRRNVALLWIVPVITMGVAMTGRWHGLLFESAAPNPASPIANLIYSHGAWFWIDAVYNYLLMFAGTFFLVRTVLRSPQLYRRQAGAALIAAVIPWVGNAIYLAGLSPIPGLDLTPFTFTITGAILVWSLFRFRLFDLVPVARDTLIEDMSDGVLVLDAQNRIVDINPAAQRLIGAAALPVGQHVEKVLEAWSDASANSVQALIAHYRDAPEARAEVTVEGDTPRHFDLRISPLYDRHGRFSGRLIVWRDITELKQVQEQLLQQQRALAATEERERLSRELHDSLCQVLSYVSAQAQVALNLIEEDQATTAATHLVRLIDVAQDTNIDIREFILGTRTAAALGQSFFGALEQYLQQFSQMHDLSTTLSRPDADANALLTPAAQMQLLRIIQEALSNIRKHAQADSAQVIFTYTDDEVQVVIADDGVGFDPIQEMDGGSEHFGLAVMRERAEEVGGRLEVRSAPGQGTQVIVQLPLRASPADMPLESLRVLLADDHPLILEGIKNLLMTRGVDVVDMAHDGEEAVELAFKLQPDVILMDVQMPRLSGPEATRRIKAELPDTKIVMLTVSAADEDLFDAIRSGASGYLLKSLNADEFFALLEELSRGEAPLAPGLAARVLAGLADPNAMLAASGLSSRQIKVLRLVAQGMTYKEVGAELHLSERTVRYHMEQIREQLGVANRAEAV